MQRLDEKVISLIDANKGGVGCSWPSSWLC